MISQTDALFIPKNLFLFLQPSRSAMGSPGHCSGLGSGYFTLSVFLLYHNIPLHYNPVISDAFKWSRRSGAREKLTFNRAADL